MQRVDALKYFILRHYGGIYIDMDNVLPPITPFLSSPKCISRTNWLVQGCLDSLEPLRYYPVFVTDNAQNTLDNNIMGAAPHHPFFEYVTNHIWTYSLFWYPYPYLSVMYNSGQWFFTDMWEKYHDKVTPINWNPFTSHNELQDEGKRGKQLYRVIMDNRRGAEPWVFWNEGAGLTWQDWDYGLWMGITEKMDKIIRIVVMAVSGTTLVVGLIIWKCCLGRRKAMGGGASAAAANIMKNNGAKARAGLKTVADLLSPVLSPVKGKASGDVGFGKTDHELV